jgi:hypothetical protein
MTELCCGGRHVSGFQSNWVRSPLIYSVLAGWDQRLWPGRHFSMDLPV